MGLRQFVNSLNNQTSVFIKISTGIADDAGRFLVFTNQQSLDTPPCRFVTDAAGFDLRDHIGTADNACKKRFSVYDFLSKDILKTSDIGTFQLTAFPTHHDHFVDAKPVGEGVIRLGFFKTTRQPLAYVVGVDFQRFDRTENDQRRKEQADTENRRGVLLQECLAAICMSSFRVDIATRSVI